MSYNTMCEKHRLVCSPVYCRPEGRTFNRIPRILHCPGDDKNPHLLVEVHGYDSKHLTDLDRDTLDAV